MEEQKRLAEELKQIREEIQKIAPKLKMSVGEALFLFSHREIVILNAELQRARGILDLTRAELQGVRETLDSILDELKKG